MNKQERIIKEAILGTNLEAINNGAEVEVRGHIVNIQLVHQTGMTVEAISKPNIGMFTDVIRKINRITERIDFTLHYRNNLDGCMYFNISKAEEIDLHTQDVCTENILLKVTVIK